MASLDLSSCSLAVDYLFLATDGPDASSELVIEPFNAVNEQNDYEVRSLVPVMAACSSRSADTMVSQGSDSRRSGCALFRPGVHAVT